jgi:hypothetical protein
MEIVLELIFRSGNRALTYKEDSLIACFIGR